MVFVRFDDFEKTYRQLKSDYQMPSRSASSASGSGIIIFVAPMVDAICACHTLTGLLASDYIPYKIIPVRGYQDICRANEEHLQGQEKVSIL